MQKNKRFIIIYENWKELKDWFNSRFYMLEDHVRGDKALWEVEIDEYTVINILTEGDRYGIIYPEKERNYFEISIIYKSEESNDIAHQTILNVPYYVALEIIKSLKEDTLKE